LGLNDGAILTALLGGGKLFGCGIGLGGGCPMIDGGGWSSFDTGNRIIGGRIIGCGAGLICSIDPGMG